MSNFYCTTCGMTTDDPEEDTCSVCSDDNGFCRYCGSPLEGGLTDTCDGCQDLVDGGEFDTIFDEEDEDFLRVPFGR